MQKLFKLIFPLILLIMVVFAPTTFANSAEPPLLTVTVSFPPDDLTLSVRFADGSVTDAVELHKEQKAWETYYRFFYWMSAPARPSLEGATLIVKSNEKNFERQLPKDAAGYYNSLLTLDIANESLTADQSASRSIFLISLRVILTLFIEGLIFFAFGYRKKASWLAFFAVNLLTQGALNIALAGFDLNLLWFFIFVFCEIIVFIVEMTAFVLILKEHKKKRAVGYAFTANLASLILGGILLCCLPV